MTPPDARAITGTGARKDLRLARFPASVDILGSVLPTPLAFPQRRTGGGAATAAVGTRRAREQLARKPKAMALGVTCLQVPLRTFAVGSLVLSFPATWFTDSRSVEWSTEWLRARCGEILAGLTARRLERRWEADSEALQVNETPCGLDRHAGRDDCNSWCLRLAGIWHSSHQHHPECRAGSSRTASVTLF